MSKNQKLILEWLKNRIEKFGGPPFTTICELRELLIEGVLPKETQKAYESLNSKEQREILAELAKG